MRKVILTPEEQLKVDPSGEIRNRLARIPRNDEFHEKPSPFMRCSPTAIDEYVDPLIARLDNTAHRPYIAYVKEMRDKCGPQGGLFSFHNMDQQIQGYFERAENTHIIDRRLIEARDYLIRRIKQHIEQVGYPDQSIPFSSLKTWAGSPTALQKGDFLAEAVGAKPWRHCYPTVPGQRRMRNKDRVIFQDSVLNVRYIEKPLTSVRNWLKREFPEYFDAWRNPMLTMNARITKCIDRRSHFTEWDYLAMDKGFSLDIVRELILPIYEVLIPENFLSFASFIEELFYQPVYMGNYMYTGLHNLLSGQAITNDFETIYTVLLVIAEMMTYELAQDDVEMFVLGDDMTLALPEKMGKLSFKILEDAIELSGLADMIIHNDEKSRCVQGETRFCRKVYYPRAKRDINGVMLGAYPVNLVFNNIWRPERPAKSAGLAALADLQRLDGLEGTPDFTQAVQYVCKRSAHHLKFTEEELLLYRTKATDWWDRVYGERWDPYASSAWKLLNF